MEGQCGHQKADGNRCRGKALPNGYCPLPAHQAHAAPAQAPAREIDAEVIGARLAAVMARDAADDRLKQGRKLASRDQDGLRQPEDDTRRVPIKVVPKRVRPDSTMIIDPHTGKPPESLKRGWVTRWVRNRDWMDRPSNHRITEYTDYGYEVVTDAKGAEIKTDFGVAMQAPPEQYALRVQDKSHVGALNQKALLDDAHDLVEQTNRAADHEAVRLVAQSEHGSGRFFHDGTPVE